MDSTRIRSYIKFAIAGLLVLLLISVGVLVGNKTGVEITSADSVTIFNNGEGVIRGSILYSVGSFMGGGETSPKPGGPNRVFIWRNFSPDEEEALEKQNLRPGVAYLKTDTGEYQFIKEVDLGKSDIELCAELNLAPRQ